MFKLANWDAPFPGGCAIWLKTEFEVKPDEIVVFRFLNILTLGYAIISYLPQSKISECQFYFIHRFGAVRFIKKVIKKSAVLTDTF